MLVSTAMLDNPLDSAVTQLRHISDDQELLKSSIDAGSLRRMLVHITNINHSVVTSTDDHANARKRLKDFARTLTRMAMNSDPPNEVLTARMAQIAGELTAASEVLAQDAPIAAWRAPSSPS